MVSLSTPHALDGLVRSTYGTAQNLTFDDDVATQMLIPSTPPAAFASYVDPDDGLTYQLPQFGAASTYDLNTSFEVGNGAAVKNAAFTGLVYADDSLEVLINGTSIGVSTNNGYQDPLSKSFNIPDGLLVTGTNTVTFRVTNTSGATGLWARGSITADQIATATATVTVTGLNDAPVASNDGEANPTLATAAAPSPDDSVRVLVIPSLDTTTRARWRAASR